MPIWVLNGRIEAENWGRWRISSWIIGRAAEKTFWMAEFGKGGKIAKIEK
jgi:hypothetical protein